MKLTSAMTALALLGLALAAAPAASAQDQTQTTATYRMVLHIGPPETMLMPDQAMPGMAGEVMVPMPGMPMPDMSMVNQGNHHLEVHVYDKTSGAVVMDVMMPTITWQNQATGLSGTVSPVMAMYGSQEGKSDWHYGGNVTLPDGTYTVTVIVGGDTAVFKDVAVGGTLAQACVKPGGAGGCFASIQDAVDAAAPGATVTVAAGTYTAGSAKQVALIQKPLTLQGADAATTIIDAVGADHGLVVQQADAVTVSGFTIQDATLEGALLDRSSHVTFKGNIVRKNDSNPGWIPGPPLQAKCPGALPFNQDDCGEGLHLLGTNFSTVDGNTVEDNIGGILLSDETGPTHDNLITGNTVRNNSRDCGITLASHPAGFGPKGPLPGYGVYANTVKGNTSDHNGAAGAGIFTPTPGTAAYDNTITGNTLTNNGMPGVALHSHAPGQNLNGNTITHNTLSGNGADDDAGTPDSGIVVFSDAASHAAPITGTTIAGNTIAKESMPMYVGLNPGTTLSGTLVNDTGGTTDDYSVIGDGNSYTVTAALTGIDPNFPAAGVIVYGPSGQVAQSTLRGGTATVPLTTTKGTVYTVQVNSYEPHSQAAYTLAFAASS